MEGCGSLESLKLLRWSLPPRRLGQEEEEEEEGDVLSAGFVLALEAAVARHSRAAACCIMDSEIEGRR